jgi:hypothetical protein
MKWQGIQRQSLDVSKTAEEGLLAINTRFKVNGELRRRRGIARSNIIKKSNAVNQISGFSAYQSNVMAALVDGSNLQGYQQPAALWGDNPVYTPIAEPSTALGFWLSGTNSAASTVIAGTGADLNTIGFYAGYVVHTRSAAPAGPLGAGYVSGRATGSAGVAPFPGYTRASVTLASPTQLTWGAYIYRSATKKMPTLTLSNDATSATSPITLSSYGSSGDDKARVVVGSTFSATEFTVPEATWTHLLVTSNADTGVNKLYVNGLLVDTMTEAFTCPTNPNVILWTGDSAVPSFLDPFMNGFAQGIFIYNGIASFNRITQLAYGLIPT